MKHHWRSILRDLLEEAPAKPERNAKILLHRYIGKRGFTVSRLNVGDQYGQIGSRGVVWQLSTWRDP